MTEEDRRLGIETTSRLNDSSNLGRGALAVDVSAKIQPHPKHSQSVYVSSGAAISTQQTKKPQAKPPRDRVYNKPYLPTSFPPSIIFSFLSTTLRTRISTSLFKQHKFIKTLTHRPILKFNMQLQQLLVLALGAGAYANNVASGVSCWKSGPTVSVSNIAPSIVAICNYLQSSGYVPQETRNQCVQDNAGIMWDFALTVSED